MVRIRTALFPHDWMILRTGHFGFFTFLFKTVNCSQMLLEAKFLSAGNSKNFVMFTLNFRLIIMSNYFFIHQVTSNQIILNWRISTMASLTRSVSAIQLDHNILLEKLFYAAHSLCGMTRVHDIFRMFFLKWKTSAHDSKWNMQVKNKVKYNGTDIVIRCIIDRFPQSLFRLKIFSTILNQIVESDRVGITKSIIVWHRQQ